MKKTFGIGIDIGATKIAGAIFDNEGEISERLVSYLNGKGGKDVVNLVIDMILDLDKTALSKNHDIRAIGIGVPGIYYANSGEVWAPNIPAWDRIPLRDLIMESLDDDKDVRIDSDRACYILGETWKGIAIGCTDAIYLAVGTGIGAGILVNGKVLRGKHDIAGAIGWMGLKDEFNSEYKTYGCFEYHASGNGLSRMMNLQLSQDSANNVNEDIEPIKVRAQDIFEAYKNGDLNAISVIDQAVQLWAKASANLVSLFDPEMIIFGGGVFGPGIDLIPQIYQEAKKWAQPISMNLVRFESSQLGPEAGMYGAGRLALQSSSDKITSN